MGFRKDAYAKLWSVEDKGNYHVAEISTSKKDKENENKYVTDFQSKFVRLVGDAHKKALELDGTERIRIGDCDVTSSYDKEKKREYTNFVIYTFELADGSKSSDKSSKDSVKDLSKKKNTKKSKDEVNDDLPF